jgi:uncharacterized protein
MHKIEMEDTLLELKSGFNQLIDVDKHYLRKECLLFPYLEQIGITGPPKVMWGKHDDIREMLATGISIPDIKPTRPLDYWWISAIQVH